MTKNTLWTVLAVPALWLGYTWAHESLGGTVPYPFLDPSQGIGRLGSAIGAIVVAGLVVVTALRLGTGLRFVREHSYARSH